VVFGASLARASRAAQKSIELSTNFEKWYFRDGDEKDDDYDDEKMALFVQVF
jgi:hypothetical protein